MKRVFIIEDDRDIVELVRYNLANEGFQVSAAHDGATGLATLKKTPPDILLLDLMLPKLSGLEICREIRRDEALNRLPILMLTARDGIDDRVSGLRTGADDYLTKPFAFDELLARITALLRRSRIAQPAVLTVADLTLDPTSRRVTRGGTPITLTPKEYAILEALMRHAGQVVSRTRLAERVWNEASDVVDNLVDVHVSHLRKKVDHPGSAQLIHTIRGIGYRLELETP